MVYCNEHSQEIYWLKRRIKLLEELDQVIDKDDADELALQIAEQFRKVERASDVIDRLRDIYGKALS
jgi:pyruvate formate-lyase activating enzyme-like uncharacterized protein